MLGRRFFIRLLSYPLSYTINNISIFSLSLEYTGTATTISDFAQKDK